MYRHPYISDVSNTVHGQARCKGRTHGWAYGWPLFKADYIQQSLHFALFLGSSLTYKKRAAKRMYIYIQTTENGDSHRRAWGSLQNREWSVKSEQGEGVALSCRQEETRHRDAQIARESKLGFITPSMSVEQMVEMAFRFGSARYKKNKNSRADPPRALKAYRGCSYSSVHS